jgi:hypothetical protein
MQKPGGAGRPASPFAIASSSALRKASEVKSIPRCPSSGLKATGIAKVFPFEHVDEVSDVSVEVYVLAQQVRTFAKTREGRGEDFVALSLQ